MVLGTAVFLFSLTWATIVFFSTLAADRNHDGALAFVVALVCFFCFAFVLHFVSSLLLDIVNSVYICYAMDKDAKQARAF